MKKIILYIIGIFLVLQSCEKDPAFDFKGEDRIYFSFPKQLDYWGNETTQEIDSIVYSFVMKPADLLSDTIWVKVKRVGVRSLEDKPYVVSVVADSSTAVAGQDFETLKTQYVFRKNLGVDSFPVIVYREHLKTVLNKRIMLQLEDTPDFKVGFIEYKNLKLSISDFLQEPNEWYLVAGTLGDYHYLKYEKWIELTGTMEFGSSTSYREYYCGQIKEYFNTNIIEDPLTGERVTCNL